MKRLLVISDLHCGHKAGLTPTRWQIHANDTKGRTKLEKFASLQREAWDWYAKTVSRYGPYDLVVVNGDAIDGRGDRSGGTEQITTDRHEQVTMAETCIQRALTKSTKLLMTYGTPYHAGEKEDWEGLIASDLNAVKIGSHEWVDVEGVIFDFKHHLSGSQVPHTRGTAISREVLWSKIWSERGLQPRTDVLIRSHVHFHAAITDPDLGLRMTTPALQTMGTKYGARRCSGTVHFGLLIFDVHKREMNWKCHLAKLVHEVAHPVKI